MMYVYIYIYIHKAAVQDKAQSLADKWRGQAVQSQVVGMTGSLDLGQVDMGRSLADMGRDKGRSQGVEQGQ